MDFGLLGPLAVTEQDRVLSLGGVKQRSLLALLRLHANEGVAADRLMKLREAWALWRGSTVLVRRGAARPGPAPDDPRTRFRWSLTGAGS